MRAAEIERHNKILVGKMTDIIKGKQGSIINKPGRARSNLRGSVFTQSRTGNLVGQSARTNNQTSTYGAGSFAPESMVKSMHETNAFKEH